MGTFTFALTRFLGGGGAVVAGGGELDLVSQTGTASNDIGSGSTSETVVGSITLPALGAHASVDLQWFWSGSGTGNKRWRVRLGGTGTDGTTIWDQTSTNAVGKYIVTMCNTGATNAQVTQSGAISAYASTTAAHTTSAVQTSAGVTLYLTVTKSTGADVVNRLHIHGRVFQ